MPGWLSARERNFQSRNEIKHFREVFPGGGGGPPGAKGKGGKGGGKEDRKKRKETRRERSRENTFVQNGVHGKHGNRCSRREEAPQ